MPTLIGMKLLVDIKKGVMDSRRGTCLNMPKEKRLKSYINAWEYAENIEMKNTTFFIDQYIAIILTLHQTTQKRIYLSGRL
jgi:hypothetical protein